jgi:hypothetical protein
MSNYLSRSTGTVFMDEFLLLALIMIYVAICYGYV